MSIGQLLGLFGKGLLSPELWFLICLVALQMGGTYALQRALWMRLSPERRAQGWNEISWGAAIFLAPMPWATMVPFCWVTRPRRGVGPGVVAILAGLAWSVGLVFALELGGRLLMWIFGVEIDGI